MCREPLATLIDWLNLRVFRGGICGLSHCHVTHYFLELGIKADFKQVLIKLQLINLLLFDVLIDIKLTMQIILEESAYPNNVPRWDPQNRLI